MNGYKVNNIIKEIMGKDYNNVSPLKKLVSLVKGSLIDASDEEALNDIIFEYNISFGSNREQKQAIEIVPIILEKCRLQTNIIDFDDMIWLPLVNNYPLPKYDVMFVDEAQDFNESQRELISRCVNGGRCIIVGDRNQAIYGFRGADSNSIDLFIERLEEKQLETLANSHCLFHGDVLTQLLEKRTDMFLTSMHMKMHKKEWL